MKITMLGASGSGKTVYMSAMSELFYNGDVEGYAIANRGNDYIGSTFVNKGFNDINSLYELGKFPSGTSKSTIMNLELRYYGEHLIDLDWIDYRGGALKELANGVENPQNTEIFAALMASDVVMVFVDAAVLKVCKNDITARSKVGANEISMLLNLITRKKHIDIVFLLSKADSSIVNVNKDFSDLKARIAQIYSRFFAETRTDVSKYPVIPVGAIGSGNVETTYEWRSDGEGGRVLVFNNKITDFDNMKTMNIASSFATALLKCLESETNKLTIKASKLSNELETLKRNLGPVRNLIDMLFNNSKKREHIFSLERIILDSREEIMGLTPHKSKLEIISSRKK